MTTYTICTALPGDPETATVTLTKLPCGTVHLETEQDGQLTLERVERIWVEAEGDCLVLEAADGGLYYYPTLGAEFLEQAAEGFPLGEAPDLTDRELIHTWVEADGEQPFATLTREANKLIYRLRTPDNRDWLNLQAFEHATAGGTFYTALTPGGQVLRLT